MSDTEPVLNSVRARRARNRRKLLLVALADPTEPLVAVMDRLKVTPADVAKWLRSAVFARDAELLRRRLVQLATLELARGALRATSRLHEQTGTPGAAFTDANVRACESLQKLAGVEAVAKPPPRKRSATAAPHPGDWADPTDLRRTRRPVHPDATDPDALLAHLEKLRKQSV